MLTRQALKRGAKIMNRVMVFDLLADENGSICGAIGISTRDNKVILFKAKSVILGSAGRPGDIPGAGNCRAFR